MSINPLQAYVPTTASPDSRVGKQSGGSSGFGTLLDALRGGDGSQAVRTQQAAAELLRMEMMHDSLYLDGEGDTSRPSGIRALESLLSGQAAGHRAAPAWKGPVPQSTDKDAALLQELTDVASPGETSETDEIGRTAAQFLGTPYRFGGEGANGIDCSSFVQQVFHEHQIDLPRTAREQIKMGSDVAQGDLKKGDLVFFQTYASYPSHVGIYLGDGKMIHASSGKGEVTVSDMNSDYYRSRFLGAKRVA